MTSKTKFKFFVSFFLILSLLFYPVNAIPNSSIETNLVDIENTITTNFNKITPISDNLINDKTEKINLLITIDELIDSYDYDYSDGSVNITGYDDYGVDDNNNSLYDRLIVNLSVDNVEGNYSFIGDLYRNGTLITTSETKENLTAGTNYVQLEYNPKILTTGDYNLSVGVYSNYLVIFSNDNAYTIDFNQSLYEQPDVSVDIDSYEVFSGFLRINATVNVTNSSTYEITAYLRGNNKTLSTKDNYSLSNGSNLIEIDFNGNDIRKSRITNATLYLINVKGSDYNFDFDYAIDYNLTDFEANDSMLADSYSDYAIDLNANNLSDYLIINVSVDVNTSGNYTIDLALYGIYDEYVKQIEKNESLSLGNQTVQVYINGTDIYQSKVNGPYVLSYVALKRDNETLDSVVLPYTTSEYFYENFEKPPLPDLLIENLFLTEEVDVDIKNNGTRNAFAFTVSFFDENFSLIKEELISQLDSGNSRHINFTNSSISRIYVIVDLNNEVDEENETNNQDSNIKRLDIALYEGWNLISVPLILDNSSVSAVFNGLNYSDIFGYYTDWFNASEINNTLGYWIKMDNNDTLTIEGSEMVNTTINLTEGRNLIGYPSLVEQDISINGSVFGYEDGLWYGNPTFKPGFGYWVNVDENSSLTVS